MSTAGDARGAAVDDTDLGTTTLLDRFYGSSVRGPGGAPADSERLRDSVGPSLPCCVTFAIAKNPTSPA